MAVASRLRSARAWLGARIPALERRPIFLVAAVLLGVGTGFGLYLAADITTRLPDLRALSSLARMPEATVVYDAFDRPVFTIFREQRVQVPLERVSPRLIDAVLAIEDRRFHEHGGVDLVRVAGATVANLMAGRLVQGGSTITQQLARQALLSRDKTFRRKAAEVVTAWWIERAYGKDEILELYLNRIYFGAGFYGVEAAARGYFGKPAADLGIPEAALLAGLIRAPEGYSPREFPERALARRNVVLDVMLDTGIIDAEAHAEARQQPLELEHWLQAAERRHGGYFNEEVRRQLITMLGWDVVYEQGLRVYTTLDPAMQRAAETAVEAGARAIEARRAYPHARLGEEGAEAAAASGPDYLQAAFIALDPRSGEVRALVGGRDFAASPFNRATQARRQPGSAFKPILYAAALDQGLTAATVLDRLDDPVPTVQGAWLPDEGDDVYPSLTLRTALQVSSNRAAVRLLGLTGIDRTVDHAARFGLGRQPRVPSVALGSGTVTLQELTAAYAAFANRGVVPATSYIRRITDRDGGVLFDAGRPGAAVRPAVVSPATAFIMADLLRGVVDAGTGARVRREGFSAPAGGKTGTTDDYKDAWFIGFTPALAAGVWLGFDAPRTIVPGGYASDLAAPVWAHFMRTAAAAAQADTWIEQPTDVVTVEVCTLSGAVATDACRRRADTWLGRVRQPPTQVEFFAAGSEPVDQCPLHRDRSFLALVTAPFRRSSEPDARPPDRRPAPTAAARPIGSGREDTASPGVPVVHQHLFGQCSGRLVAGPEGVRYVTAHKDAFTVTPADVVRVRLDAERGHLEIATRRGRVYDFQAAAADRGGLAAIERAMGAR